MRTDAPRLSADERDELAAAAMVAERRNRPRGLVVASAVATGLALLLLAWGGVRLLAAQAALERQRSILVDARAAAAELAAVRAFLQSPAHEDVYAPMFDIPERVQRLATQAGLGTLRSPEERAVGQARAGTNVRLNTWQYSVQRDSMEPVLEWIDRARTEIPGLAVRSITIRPGGNQWNVDVTFSRWERR